MKRPASSRALREFLPDIIIVLFLAAAAWLAARNYVLSSLFIWGDHPGQFMRFWYPTAVSVPQYGRVLDWNPLWYAGYPELQFYPPGHALLGLALNAITLGRLSVERVYNLIPAVALVLPVFTTFAFLRTSLAPLGRAASRVAGLVAAALALTFTPMWGGTNAVPIGLMGERLAFGVVPLVLLAGWKLVERPSRRRLALAAALLAVLVLLHPFHAPAAVIAVCGYGVARWLLLRLGRDDSAVETERKQPRCQHPERSSDPHPERNAVESKGGRNAVEGSRSGSTMPHPSTALPSVAPLRMLSLGYIGSSQARWPWLAEWLLLAVGFAAWWLVPLVVRQAPYSASLLRTTLEQTTDWLKFNPVIPNLLVAAAIALALLAHRDWRVRSTVGVLALLIPTLVLIVLLDYAILFERLNITALDPIRFIAEYYLAFILLTGAAAGAIASRFLWRVPLVAAGLAVLFVVALRPVAIKAWADLPYIASVPRESTRDGLFEHPAFDGLWQALAQDPAADGRVLFTSYYTRVTWSDGQTTPTAIKSMTPYLTGREIMGGTFSHWSPGARLLWVGDPWVSLLPAQVELEDDQQMMGIPWSEMSDATLFDAVRALNVTTIVADMDDTNARAMLDAAPHFQRFWENGYFVLYHVVDTAPAWVEAHGARASLIERSARRWVIQVDGAEAGATLTAKMAFYPLWRADAGGRRLAVVSNRYGMQQIGLPAGGPAGSPAGDPFTVTLEYHEGWPEWGGLAVSIGALAAALLLWLTNPGAGRERGA